MKKYLFLLLLVFTLLLSLFACAGNSLSDLGEHIPGELQFTLSDDGTYYILTGIGTYRETELVIPESYKGIPVTHIGDFAFSQFDSLVSVTIPHTIVEISERAFESCFSVVEVINHSSLDITCQSYENGGVASYAFEVHEGPSKMLRENGFLFYTFEEQHYLVGYEGKSGDITLPQSFRGEDYEMHHCFLFSRADIVSVTIPEGIEEIPVGAFCDCENLVQVSLPHSLETIQGNAFSRCTSLTSIYIPENVHQIREYAFVECTSLSSFEVDPNNPILSSIDGNLYAMDGEILLRYAPGKMEKQFVIPEGVIEIGEYAFCECTTLGSVVIPDSVIYIAEMAFYNSSICPVIYYTGTEEQWAQIDIDFDREALHNVTIYYNYIPEE